MGRLTNPTTGTVVSVDGDLEADLIARGWVPERLPVKRLTSKK